jgi:hypothetical protein
LTWLGHFGLLEIVCGQDGNAHVRKGFVFHREISFGSLLIFQFLQSRFQRLTINLPIVRQSSEAASDGVKATRSAEQALEDVEDLIADLRQALDAASAESPQRTRNSDTSTMVEEPTLV